jgi:hypothetical protein
MKNSRRTSRRKKNCKSQQMIRKAAKPSKMAKKSYEMLRRARKAQSKAKTQNQHSP